MLLNNQIIEEQLEVLCSNEGEPKTKMFYLYLLIAANDVGYVDCPIDVICQHLGVSKSVIYRARSRLCSYGLIDIGHEFCSKTGKKLGDNYTLLFRKD